MFGAQGGDQALMDLTADAQPQMLDLGILAEQRVGDRAGQCGFVGDQQRDLAQHGDHPHGRIRRLGRLNRAGRQPSPENLGHQMLFGGEVRVRGGRANTGFRRDHTNRQPGEAFSAQHADRRVAQPLNGVGLLSGQAPSGRFPNYRVGHVSGHYYTDPGAATERRAACTTFRG